MDIELSVLSLSLDCYCVLGNQSNIKTTKVFEMAEVFVSALCTASSGTVNASG